jgi:aminopeptidase YwaD
MSLIRFLIPVLFCFSSIYLFAQVEEGRRITKELCAPKYFGRGYVNSGDSLAAVYLANEFQNKGIKPIKKSYFQPFSFDVNTFPGEMNVTLNGQELRTGIDYIVDPNSGGGDGEWKFKILSEAEIFNIDSTRKILQAIEKMAYNSVVIDARNYKGDSLKTANAIANAITDFASVMLVTDEKFTFSVGSKPMRFPFIFVQGFAYQPAKQISTKIDQKLKKQHVANNVIAAIPSTNKKAEYLVFTAHYDHLGGMGNKTYFPGGNDNASGTSMLFALADYFKENPVSYHVVFIAFAGEEAGLIGSKYFVDHPLVNLKKIKFLLNLDIMGSGEEGITVVNATLFPAEFEKLISINEKENYLSKIKKRGPAANSDHYWFTEKGVPAFFLYTMGDNKHYHDVFDTYEELTFSKYNDIVKLIAAFAKTF